MKADLRNELRALVDSLATSMAQDLERIVERHAVRLVAERLGANLQAAGAKGARTNGRNGGAPAAQPPKKPKAARANGTYRARILAYVQAHPGDRTENVRAALGISRGAWVYTVNRLIAEKKLARQGERRKATLHTP